MTATTTDIRPTVAEVRKHLAAIRTMNRNTRLGLYDGRNGGGNTSHRAGEAHRLLRTLPKRLQGLLTLEHGLAERISENKDLGQDRPELRKRLRDCRREIHKEVNPWGAVAVGRQGHLRRSPRRRPADRHRHGRVH